MNLDHLIGQRDEFNYNLIHLSKTSSTNDFAVDIISKSEPEGIFVVFADEQTAGRGQYGRKWQSEAGKNLLFSVCFSSDWLPLDRIFDLQLLASCALWECVFPLLSQSITLQIKWPNDLIANHSKLAGILIQNSIRDYKLSWSLIGIGLNVDQTDFQSLDKATSLKILTNQSFDRMKILKQFMNVFLERLNLLKNGPQDIFMNLYRKHLYGSNEYLTAEINGKKIDQIKIIDVLPTGQINVEISGLQKIFSFGDIRFFLSD